MPIPSSGQESVRTKQPAELPIFYSPAYTMSANNFDTTRKATWVATSLRQRPISGVVLIAVGSQESWIARGRPDRRQCMEFQDDYELVRRFVRVQ